MRNHYKKIKFMKNLHRKPKRASNASCVLLVFSTFLFLFFLKLLLVFGPLSNVHTNIGLLINLDFSRYEIVNLTFQETEHWFHFKIILLFLFSNFRNNRPCITLFVYVCNLSITVDYLRFWDDLMFVMVVTMAIA